MNTCCILDLRLFSVSVLTLNTWPRCWHPFSSNKAGLAVIVCLGGDTHYFQGSTCTNRVLHVPATLCPWPAAVPGVQQAVCSLHPYLSGDVIFGCVSCALYCFSKLCSVNLFLMQLCSCTCYWIFFHRYLLIFFFPNHSLCWKFDAQRRKRNEQEHFSSDLKHKSPNSDMFYLPLQEKMTLKEKSR